MADRLTGKIKDGQHCKFRCFSASQECAYSNVRKLRWENYELLEEAGTTAKMSKLIQKSMPKGFTTVRPGISGDFFRESYFLAWLDVANKNPNTVFYGYTKATPFLVKYKDHIPSNFRFAASKGGTCDNLINKHSLNFSEVVFSVKEAEEKGLEIDHDDSLAYAGNKSFALLIHGTQPAGSEASKAWQKIKSTIGGYNENKKPKVNGSTFIVYLNISANNRIIPTKKLITVKL